MKLKDTDMIFDDEDRRLIAHVMYTLKQWGVPLKDYMEDDDVEEALKLLGSIGKAIGVKAKRWSPE